MFENSKIGNRVYDILIGWGTITEINHMGAFPLNVNFDKNFNNGKVYTFGGFATASDKIPRLYWDEIKFEIPKKPFDLRGELDKLEVKEFEFGEKNAHIYYYHRDNTWYVDNYSDCEDLSTVNFSSGEDLGNFVALLNKHNIKPLELRPLLIEKLTEVQR